MTRAPVAWSGESAAERLMAYWHAIVDRMERTIAAGLADGSLSIDGDHPRAVAQVL
ncbi:hypothetical protein [Nonomuraea turcica]|uniref:hypothetical protein n=1 Tax=Nonomuraea sp. G32 TaxID=3067274 RepID=UPI00273AD69B|nr:hypothetical protein [Nonomuraea sp. G32]MDP4505180.1 hypothetical protein [Nonomuraea sp. G32]